MKTCTFRLKYIVLAFAFVTTSASAITTDRPISGRDKASFMADLTAANKANKSASQTNFDIAKELQAIKKAGMNETIDFVAKQMVVKNILNQKKTEIAALEEVNEQYRNVQQKHKKLIDKAKAHIDAKGTANNSEDYKEKALKIRTTLIGEPEREYIDYIEREREFDKDFERVFASSGNDYQDLIQRYNLIAVTIAINEREISRKSRVISGLLAKTWSKLTLDGASSPYERGAVDIQEDIAELDSYATLFE